MTDLQTLRARALAECAVPSETFDQKFIASMAHNAKRRRDMDLSPKQAECLAKLAWKYRSQIPRDLVPAQDPYTLAGATVSMRDDGEEEKL